MPMIPVLMLSLALAADGGSTIPIGTPVSGSPAERARTTAKIVSGIISYARWPDALPKTTLCIMGTSPMSDALPQLEQHTGSTVEVHRVAAGIIPADCNVIYLTRVSPPAQAQIFSTVRGRAILSITDADPACRMGAMFCLRYAAETISFNINIDAISRSLVRVDPRVLRLSRHKASLTNPQPIVSE
ncbi:YfiR family protein [Sphingomonas paeninsulae]|uniref:YfiR family protein n=1 Tax=Sphingomonas paeninsulae TaxID=2319844 RepID=A0A494TIW9_SPHPE|nr:YfiR family protein [Sphingomonas paeninsulae]AYJ87302.1 YfiR family protein [Sphingomonas paeninsulae]